MHSAPCSVLVIAARIDSAATLISYLSRHDLTVIGRSHLDAVDAPAVAEACVLLHEGFVLMDLVDAARRWMARDVGPLIVITAEIPTVRRALGLEHPHRGVCLLPRQTFAWTVCDLLTSTSDTPTW